MARTLFITVGLLLSAIGVAASDSTMVDSSQGEEIPVDTLLFEPGQVLQSFAAVTDSTNREARLIQNPTTALLKSIAVPGLGQLGNRRYLKAVLFFGLDVWMVGSAIHYGRQASDYRDLYSATDPGNISLRNDYYSLYRDRKDERNKLTWYAVLVTFFSMFDAYVDAHLSGFPRKEDDAVLSMQLVPDCNGRPVASLSLSF